MINATIKAVNKGILTVFALLLSFSVVQAQETLLISEYIEGSSNNKAIELYNPNSTAVTLDSYQIAQSVNGGGWEFYHTFPGGASIAPYGTYVIITDAVAAELFAAANADEVLSFPSVVHHNGDDARAIIHISGTDTTVIDLFGDPDNDPGSGWAVGDTATGTQNHTLVRNSDVAAGNTTVLGSFGTDDATSEWSVRAQNDFSNLGQHSFDGAPFTIRDLNTYENLTEFSVAGIEAHPLTGDTVQFTAVIVSYPKSSGLANPDDNDNDGVTDDIGRIHIFVTDTNAVSMGRAGMSIQIVESDYRLIDQFTRGDIVTFTGDLGFFNATQQVDVHDNGVSLVGNVNEGFPQYASLLDPWEIDISEINTFENGQLSMNIANYSKYIGSYVKFTGATVSNVSVGDRSDWALNQAGSRIYIYDTSLRVRNDHAIGAEGYLPDYNARRVDSLDGDFVPPAAGANVDISGFITYNGDDPDGLVPSGNGALSVNPFEDGVVWLNGNRFVDGEDIGGEIFNWPNDIIVNGLPPVFSNVFLSDSTVTAEDAVTVTATIQAVEGKTLTGVELIYTAGETTASIAMTANGDIYSATLPTFDAGTAVNFTIEATDSEGLVGVAPLSGVYSFFVQGEALASISEIQETSDGMPGDSPVAGTGTIAADITATVVSTDGFVSIQDRAAAWSGVFVDASNGAENLSVGDIVNITELSVAEVFGVTTVTLTAFTETGTNDMVDTLAVTGLITQDIAANYEPYEGVFITFEDLKVTTNQADGSSDFGEWEIGSVQGGGAADTLAAGDGLRVDDLSSNVSSTFNEYVKVGASLDSFTGVLYFSFGNPKMVFRSEADVVGADWSIPNTSFDLESPNDGASLEVTGDVAVTWEPSFDLDGNDVTYEWVLYSADSSTVVAAVTSDSEGADTTVTLDFATVDALLASAGLGVGESADFVWNVRVSDGVDTVAVSSGYDLGSNSFTPLYYSLTLERGVMSNNEVNAGVPDVFALEQNYPNPFNPSTNIEFSLPQASRVTLIVFDMLGRKVATLVNNERMEAANHSIRFDASRLASGMYIYRMDAGSFTSTRKMMLIK